MTIPRGYIPGQNDFPVITSVSGSISFDDENLQTTGNITCNGLISPDIKALLVFHDYQYVYDCSTLLESSNHKWIKALSGTGNITTASGEVAVTDVVTTGYAGFYKSGLNFQPNDSFVLNVRAKQTTSGVQYLYRLTENDGVVYSSSYLRFSGGQLEFCGQFIAMDITVYHDYVVFKDKQNYVYLFVDGVLTSKVAYSSLTPLTSAYGTTYALVGLGYPMSVSGSGVLVCDYYKYSILKEGSKANVSTSSKIIGGSLDVQNQPETSGIQVTSAKILSTGTNQNVEIEANGIGEIVANSNFTGNAIEGALQHKYSGTLKTATNYDISPNEGFILTSSASNAVDLDLPNAGSFLGREIIINTGNASNSTTITCDGASNKILGMNGTAYDTCTLTGVSKFVRLVATNGIYWQITSKSDTGVTFS